MPLCKAKPVSLPSLALLGLELDDQHYFKKTRRHQTTAIANKKPTPGTSHHPTFSKRPDKSNVNALRDPLSSGERLTDINYYLSAGGDRSPARARSSALFAPDGTEDIQPAENSTVNPHFSFLSQVRSIFLFPPGWRLTANFRMYRSLGKGNGPREKLFQPLHIFQKQYAHRFHCHVHLY